MEILLNRGGLRLPKGDYVKLTHPSGSRVSCQRGSLWITQDGDPRDVILADGESFSFDRPGPAVVFALQKSAFALCPAL